MDENTAILKTLSSKRLPHPINFPFTAYSHKHDLLAIVTSASEVQVFRIASGQLAFTVKKPDAEAEVTALSWKPDGSCLGVGWSDGKFGIYDGGTGRQMRLTESTAEDGEEELALDLSLPTPKDEDEESTERAVRVTCLGFVGRVNDLQPRIGARERDEGLTTDDWYDLQDGHGDDDEDVNGIGGMQSSVADLPGAIAALDATSVLPRLSAIQAHGYPFPRSGPGASKFGSQAATDTQFETQRTSTLGVVQSLLVCQEDCTAQVLRNETVRIGSRTLVGRPLMHAGHSRSSTDVVLCEGENEQDSLRMTFIDLPLSSLDGPLLQVITTNTKRMQTLLDYVVQTTRCIQHDYTSNALIPDRFLNLLAEDLQSKEPEFPDIVANFYHLAMTGNLKQGVLSDWIVEFLKDANIRRWEQHINNMYANMQTHLFMNLLPALDRFSIAVVALRGQAKFQEGTSHFDCKPHHFTNLLEIIDSIRLVAQKMLLIIQSEHRQFRAFIRWMKMQIEIAVAEPFSQTALETEDREVPSIDYPLVMAYIKNNMMQSKLAMHVQNRPTAEERGTCGAETFFQKAHIRDLSYEGTKEALRQLDSGQTLKLKDVEDPESLLNLPALTCALMGRVTVLLQRITEWQKNVVFSPIDPPSIDLELPAGSIILDMAMTPASIQQGCSTKLLAFDPNLPEQLALLEVLPATSPSSPRASFHPPKQQLIRQVYDSDVLDAKLLPYTKQPVVLALLRQLDNNDASCQLVKHNIETQRFDILHYFGRDTGFKPEQILVGGRKGKLLVVVFGSRGREWRVLDLDNGVETVSQSEGKGKGVVWDEHDNDDDDDDDDMDVA